MAELVLARTTEYGSRTLALAASLGSESHGQYLHDCKIAPSSHLVASGEGKTAQDLVCDELLKMLEPIRPGVRSNI